MKSWLGEVWCFVRTINLILDPWFVLKSSSFEIVPKETISSKHFMQYQAEGLFCKYFFRFVGLFYYILFELRYGIYHAALHDGYL